MIKVDTITAPSHWGNALVNGEFDGLDDEDKLHIEAFIESMKPAYVVSAIEGSDRITRHYQLYDLLSKFTVGEVVDFPV